MGVFSVCLLSAFVHCESFSVHSPSRAVACTCCTFRYALALPHADLRVSFCHQPYQSIPFKFGHDIRLIKQSHDATRKSLSNRLHVVNGNISFASLYRPNVRPVKPTLSRKILLGHIERQSPLFHPASEQKACGFLRSFLFSCHL